MLLYTYYTGQNRFLPGMPTSHSLSGVFETQRKSSSKMRLARGVDGMKGELKPQRIGIASELLACDEARSLCLRKTARILFQCVLPYIF